MFCHVCGKRILKDSAFCRYCGIKQLRNDVPEEKSDQMLEKGSDKVKRNKSRGNGQGSVYRAKGSWIAVVTIGYAVDDNGVLHRKTRAKWGFKTKADALAYLPELRIYKPKEPNITVLQVYEQWSDRHKQRVGKSTMDGYKAAWKYFNDIQYLPIVNVTAQDYQQCIDRCPQGKRTKENMKALAGLLCKFACDLQVLDRNRAENLYTGNDEKGTRPPFTKEEVEIIRKAAESGIPYADYVYCMIYTGFRPSEMLELKLKSYNEQEKTLTGGGKTKAGTDRIVTLSPKVIRYIENRVKESGESGSEYIFPNKAGRMFSLKNFTEEYFKPLMASLGIKDRTPYSCRHTFANLLKNVQGSDMDKAALIGHADPSMTKYYQSEELSTMRNITNAI